MYKKMIDPVLNEVSAIFNSENGMIIPIDERNTDYQVYLSWLSEGNEPEEYKDGM